MSPNVDTQPNRAGSSLSKHIFSLSSTKRLKHHFSFSILLRLSIVLSVMTGYTLTSFLAFPASAQAAVATPSSSTTAATPHTAAQTTPSVNSAAQYTKMAQKKSLALKRNQVTVSAQTPLNGLGDLSLYTYVDNKNLTDQLSMKVNVANGNLLLHQNDLKIQGTGLNVDMGRYYNSLYNEEIVDAGWNWTWSFGRGLTLDLSNPNTGVTLTGPSGFQAYFPSDGNGEFKDAPGLNATLYHFHDSSNNYQVAFHKSGLA